MKYPDELILPFALLFFLITVYIVWQVFSCNCYTTTIFNNLESRRKRKNILILDAENSFNAGLIRNNNSTFNLWCCFCTVVNRCRSQSLVYVQDAEKIQYGTVNNLDAPTTDSTQNGTKCENAIMNDVCPICFEKFSEQLKVVQLKCHHVFHSSCIAKWFNSSTSYHCGGGTCPLCKDTVDTQVICNPEQIYFADRFRFYQDTNFGMNV